ncbi:MAG TPA: hypothetical protein VJ793_17520 [Anaerolineae bacterium]|nr:hypothetical protein [Anaerolineae bacterium]
MSRYVADSTATLLKIHARLQEWPALDNALTALIFLDEREVVPYHPPLGDA